MIEIIVVEKEVHNPNRQLQEYSNNSSNNTNQLQPSITNKWVINLSNTPLAPAQESLLAKGPNLAVAPKNPSVDYIAAIESVCQKLTEQDVEELRADINGLLRRAQAPKPNLNKAEVKALAVLKRDKDSIVLTADKGEVIVILDRENYIQKAENLLAQPAYRTIERGPHKQAQG